MSYDRIEREARQRLFLGCAQNVLTFSALLKRRKLTSAPTSETEKPLS
jgi:hypothetical protein